MERDQTFYKSASVRNTVATIFMCVLLFLSAANFIAAIIELIIMSPFEGHEPLDYISDFGAVVIVFSSLIDILWFLACIGFIITYLMWVNRAYKNLQSLPIMDLQHSSGWAVGWYFIPIANLFKPYIVMKETYLATTYAESTGYWKDRKAPSLILVWWLTYIVGNAIAGQNLSATYETFRDYKVDAVLSLVSEPLLICSGILLLIIMNRITKTQDKELQQRVKHEEVNGDIVIDRKGFS